jgi:hypothetical protein
MKRNHIQLKNLSSVNAAIDPGFCNFRHFFPTCNGALERAQNVRYEKDNY